MLAKSKKQNVGTSGDAHKRLQAVIQSQRTEISNQKHADERQALESALQQAKKEIRELKSTVEHSAPCGEIDRKSESGCELNTSRSNPGISIPETWKAPSSEDMELLRKRIEQEEDALALKTPLVQDSNTEDCELQGKMLGVEYPKHDAEKIEDLHVQGKSRAAAQVAAPAFKDFLKSKAGVGAQPPVRSLEKADKPLMQAPKDLSSELTDRLNTLEITINNAVSESEYDIDFTVDHITEHEHDTFDEDSIPILTTVIAGKAARQEHVISQTCNVASSFTMPISALLSSWLLSISRKSAVSGAVQRSYLVEDDHENREINLFSDGRSIGMSRSHCLARLNDWGDEVGVPQPGVFHVFRPRFVSTISKDSMLLTRPQDSACFYKWVTPLSAKNEQTVLQAFVEKQLPYLHSTISRQITDAWKVAREVKASGLVLSETSLSDLSAKNRIYEATKVLLTRPLLSSLFSVLSGTNTTLIEHLGAQESVKQVRWSDMPWFDYPPQIVLFHLIAEVASSSYCSLSTARVMGLLDKILMLAPVSEGNSDNLMYIQLLDEHSKAQSNSEDDSLRDIFFSDQTQIIHSESIDIDIYENPGLEVSDRQGGLAMVRGPLISKLVSHFSGLKDNLKELGLFRPELDLVCKEIQAK